MSTEKLSRIEAWAAGMQEQAFALVEKHVSSKDEILNYTIGWRFPLDILRWIPIIGTIIDARRQRFLLAALRDRLLIMRIKRFRVEEIASELIPISSITRSAVSKFPFFCNLRIDLSNGKTYVFKEMNFDAAAGLKDAIDKAQGKPSTVD